MGAKTLNDSIQKDINLILQNDAQVIWQCGKFYLNRLKEELKDLPTDKVYLSDFVYEMDLAYAAADIIISRAGALSISELCLIGKPAVLVPSPNVSEDHQTKNAMALVKNGAAVLVKDVEAREKLVPAVVELLADASKQEALGQEILKMGYPNATDSIVDEIEKMVN